MKKTLYEAPAVEQMNIRFEENILSTQTRSVNNPNMSTQTWDDWD